MLDINKNGTASCNLLLEYIQEPDGSIWEPIFYHNNPSVNLFSSTDSFSTGVIKSPDMFFNFNVCKELTSWEFIYKQRTVANGTYNKYRWKQNKSPFTATYNDVKPSAVTRITTGGYIDGGYGGLYILNSSTYMVVANASNGNWFGASGCWNAYQGGIPGYPNTTVTTGDISIFVRIDGTNLTAKTKMYPSTGILVTNNYKQV